MKWQPIIKTLFLAMVIIGCGSFSVAQKGNADSDSRELRQFTSQFYEWYVQTAVDADRTKILDTKEMRRALAPELLQALRQDREARIQDKTGHIVGLDFDPFLAAQDSCDRYEVRKIEKKGKHYWAEIHGIGGCVAHDDPDLKAELAPRNEAWIFTNFHYPEPFANDLMTILTSLHRERMKS